MDVLLIIIMLLGNGTYEKTTISTNNMEMCKQLSVDIATIPATLLATCVVGDFLPIMSNHTITS